MFLAKHNYNKLHYLISFFDFLFLPISSQKLFAKLIQIVKTKFEL